jgi:hypothetical protein
MTITSPYADTYDAYWAAGWRGVLPLPYRAKKNPPSGFTGSTGTDPSYPDVATWAMDDGERNICLRLPDSVIGIDVDAYGDKPGGTTLALREQQWGPLPTTWRSTSRDDGTSGIRLYRIPTGLKWPGEVGPGIETVRRDHRYVVAWPSVHPETGGTYRWIDPDGIVTATTVPDPDTLPMLPDEWVVGLTGGEAATEIKRNDLAYDAAMLWIAQLPGSSAPACRRMTTAQDSTLADLASHSAHQTALAGTSRLLRLGDEGHSGVVDAILALRDDFIKEVTKATRKVIGKTVRTLDEANREWRDILVSGVNFVSAQEVKVPVCDCNDLLTGLIVANANPEPATGPTPAAPSLPAGMVDGASFILDAPDLPPAVWGYGEDVIWSEGEALTVVGPPGVGKTTLSGQIVRARLLGGSVLGYGVTPTKSKVLYLAMDRPAQIARSLRRHFTEADRKILAEKLVIWKGPPPGDVAKNTTILLSLVKLAGADTLIVDSIKDAAIGLSSDEVGAAYNQARQHVLADGAQVLELHHLVKRGPNGAKPTQLADVYGSTWITSGSGSVLLLWGQAGDLVIEVTHLKQPANDIGPLMVEHDHVAGVSTVWHGDNGEHTPIEVLLLANRRHGLTASQAAAHIFHTDEPDGNQARKVKRKLKALVAEGKAREEDRAGKPTVWFPVDNSTDPTTDPTTPDHGGTNGGDHHPTTPDHSPTNDPTTPDHDDPTTPTPSLEGGLGDGHPRVGGHPCEDCGGDTGSAGFIVCASCEKKRRQR